MLTVHDLAADWDWMRSYPSFLLLGCPTCIEWEQAEYGPRGGLRISRLVPDGSRVRQVSRYVDPDTPVFLVEPRSTGTHHCKYSDHPTPTEVNETGMRFCLVCGKIEDC